MKLWYLQPCDCLLKEFVLASDACPKYMQHILNLIFLLAQKLCLAHYVATPIALDCHTCLIAMLTTMAMLGHNNVPSMANIKSKCWPMFTQIQRLKLLDKNLKFSERANPETWCPDGKIIKTANCGILPISRWLELKHFTETNLSLTRYPRVTPLHVDAHAQSYLVVFWINLLHVCYSEEKVHNLRPDGKFHIWVMIFFTF